ncbi:MAG: ABC transporter ATP-binding protein [Chloroflexi bacterium]|nr:ABC transporter ATP-binding protein [Chloroflexota bacterium]
MVQGLSAGYNKRPVVFDASLRVGEGEIVTLVGHNGAGKSTTLRTICGLNRPFGGTVSYRGSDVSHVRCAQKVKLGISFIPSERFTFSQLSVQDNLRLGGLPVKDAALRSETIARVFEMFPVLRTRTRQVAGTMSGGEQRMLSLGISLMSRPQLLLLDEPSLGLAPAVVQRIMELIKELAERDGLSVLLVEQNVAQALRIANRVYVMRAGRVILEETAERMRQRDHLWDLF